MLIPNASWVELWAIGKPLLLWTGGMVLYAVFVFSFYERVSRRLIVASTKPDFKGIKHVSLYAFWQHIVFGLKYAFLAPLFLFGWFVLLAGLILIMNSAMPIEEGLLVGMATLATIRACAYLKEQLAEDLAKFLPLAFMGFFLVNKSDIEIPTFMAKLATAPEHLFLLLTYFGFVVVMEFVLRFADAIINKE